MQVFVFSPQIIRERVFQHRRKREGLVWNSYPGALLTLPEFSDSYQDFPFNFAPTSTWKHLSDSLDPRCPSNQIGCDAWPAPLPEDPPPPQAPGGLGSPSGIRDLPDPDGAWQAHHRQLLAVLPDAAVPVSAGGTPEAGQLLSLPVAASMSKFTAVIYVRPPPSGGWTNVYLMKLLRNVAASKYAHKVSHGCLY